MSQSARIHAASHLAFYMAMALLLVLSVAMLLWPRATISSFRDCVRAGNPVMESMPRQCATASGLVFYEQ